MALGAILQTKANEPKVEPVNKTEVVNPVQKEEGAKAAPVQTEDIISRATKFVEKESPTNKSEEEINDVLFSDKELREKLDSIQDPVLREQFVNMRKSMMRGVNTKFEEISTLRKELESLKAGQRHKFSANSVEELLNNQEFINEAQRFSGKTNELAQDDTLSDVAKQQITKLQSELEQIKKISEQQKAEESHREWTSHHDRLAQIYGNYDKAVIDKTAADLIAGKIRSTPEHIYKVIYHDENVRRAYEMGRRESATRIGEKEAVSSINGVNAIQTDSLIQEEKEDNKNFLQRIIAKRMSGSEK